MGYVVYALLLLQPAYLYEYYVAKQEAASCFLFSLLVFLVNKTPISSVTPTAYRKSPFYLEYLLGVVVGFA